MTPTLKIRRHIICQKYAVEIEDMYGAKVAEELVSTGMNREGKDGGVCHSHDLEDPVVLSPLS